MQTNRLKKLLKLIIRLNYIKTIYLNFKLLPFNTAIRFPILLFGHIDLQIGNQASLEFSNIVKMGMLRFGTSICPINRAPERSVFVILGKLILGDHIIVNPLSIIQIQEHGVLEIGNSVYIGPNTKIVASNHITIQSDTSISWECQIFDTDFHYLLNTKTSEIKFNKGPIFIGHSCWIGNRVTINKNTKLPNYSIVACNSLLNKDFGQNEQIVVGGIPAKIIYTDVKRVFDLNTESMLNNYFLSSNTSHLNYDVWHATS